MNATDPIECQPKTAKRETWGLFLTLAAVGHFVGFVGSSSIVVPPRISEQSAKVALDVAFLCMPFLISLFLIFSYRTKSERVISWSSFAASVLWLAAAASLIVQFLRGS